MNRVLYREWFPQIVYDHHQTGPPGTVMFAPPFRDPFNYVFDPLIPAGIDLVGAAMHARFAARGQARRDDARAARPTRRGGTAGCGRPRTSTIRSACSPRRSAARRQSTFRSCRSAQLPSADLPYPIAPQRWHFRQSIDYSVTANRAVLDVASRYRETLLFNVYRMGRNAIERGSRDTWTFSPRRLAALKRRRRARRVAAERLRAAARSAAARSARLHPAGGSAGFPHRDEVRRRAAQDRRDRASRHGCVHGERPDAIPPARSS